VPAVGIRRLILLLASCGTIVAGLTVSTVFAGFLADAIGDALYTVLVYLLVAIVAPRLRRLTVAGVAFGVSAVIEFLQLTGIPAALAEIFPLSRLVFGSTFVATDLIFYAGGALAAAGVDALLSRRLRRPRPGGTSRRPERRPWSRRPTSR
jgi:hypothetical protein